MLQATPLLVQEKPLPSLRANFKWTLAGNLVYAFCQWGMISVLAKVGNPSIVGEFTLGLAVSAPVFIFTNMQLRAVQATDVNVEHGFANYFMLRLLTTLFGLMVIVVMLPFDGLSSAVRIVILMVAVTKCIECMSDVIAGLLQREEQLKRVAISLMIRGIASVLAFSFSFVYFRSLALSVAAMSGVWLAVLLFYDVRNVRKLIGRQDPFFHFDRSELWRLVMLGLPLGWTATLASLCVNVPRYFLQHYMGLVDQGIYASLAYLVVTINLVVTALSVSVATQLARLFADGDHRQFVRLLTKLSMLGVLIAAVGVPLTFLVGRPLLTLLYRREYADHVGLLALFVGIAGVSAIASFLFGGLTAARSFRVQVPIFFAATLICVAGSAMLVPRFGLIGAGVGLLLSMMILMLGGVRALYQVVRVGNFDSNCQV
jgi:O-antigen/teichoic acid export membrane protein